MYVGIIMAGDGELEMCVGPFVTREEAGAYIKSVYDRVYEPTFDRWYVSGIDSIAQAEADVREMQEAAEQDEAEWNAANHPEGIIVDVRMNDHEG